MATTKDSELGICYECSTQDLYSSKKKVYHCEICKKWFCEKHLKPKYPYFVDWETVFDVQGNPEIKELFYSEHGKKEGHPDFVYLRKTVEAMKNEKKLQDERIQQRIDDMINSGPPKMSSEYKKLLEKEKLEREKKLEQLEKEQQKRMKLKKKSIGGNN